MRERTRLSSWLDSLSRLLQATANDRGAQVISEGGQAAIRRGLARAHLARQESRSIEVACDRLGPASASAS